MSEHKYIVFAYRSERTDRWGDNKCSSEFRMFQSTSQTEVAEWWKKLHAEDEYGYDETLIIDGVCVDCATGEGNFELSDEQWEARSGMGNLLYTARIEGGELYKAAEEEGYRQRQEAERKRDEAREMQELLRLQAKFGNGGSNHG